MTRFCPFTRVQAKQAFVCEDSNHLASRNRSWNEKNKGCGALILTELAGFRELYSAIEEHVAQRWGGLIVVHSARTWVDHEQSSTQMIDLHVDDVRRTNA